MAATGYIHETAFDTGRLPVSQIHTLHYEQYGKKNGKPGKTLMISKRFIYLILWSIANIVTVLYLHGGPGGQTSKHNTKYFNPAIYRVILLDQRGAGKSTPHAELRENTTQHLVSDIEVLRTKLEISKWHLVFGGSWGSTLALVYAQAFPDVVGSLILRGIFTVRQSEIQFSRGPIGAANLFPEEYERFVNYLPEEDRAHPNEAYHRLLISDDYAARVAAAREWNRWNLSIGALRPNPEALAALEDEQYTLGHARLEAHYFVNQGFLEEGQILKDENLAKIRHIPSEYFFVPILIL
jgi:proline iminopeptidase